jgi:hypothetical protein
MPFCWFLIIVEHHEMSLWCWVLMDDEVRQLQQHYPASFYSRNAAAMSVATLLPGQDAELR